MRFSVQLDKNRSGMVTCKRYESMNGGQPMPNLNWSGLNHLQLGRYAEYYAKMEFASYGYDVYTSEVDDHGVDFVAKGPDDRFVEVQVKATRGSYVFIQQDKIKLDDSHLVCYMRFTDGALPEVYLIPATVWSAPNGVFVSHDYDKPGQSSKPEWGINYSEKNRHLLEPYRAETYFSCR